jgi:hydroxylamine reductase (hybrid-cluster protein)
MANKPPTDVSIGKFDILATDVYTQDLLNGLSDDEAKQRGMVAANMGAQARLGIRKEHHEEFQAQKEAAEKKKKATITAESFDKQVAKKYVASNYVSSSSPFEVIPCLISSLRQ